MIYQQIKPVIAICCLCGFLLGCGVSGQIGDIYNFRTSKKELNAAIDSLYVKYPEYKVPAKWEVYNNFSPGPSDYLEGKTFYFGSAPEEMYYITLIDDSAMMHRHKYLARAGLAIRAVNQGSSKWLLESDLDFKEQDRVQKRFEKEIISRLEVFTKAKSSKED